MYSAPIMEAPAIPPVLLIVEDRSDVGAAFARYFRRYFEAVLVATSPSEAERLLGSTPTPTHVICDYWLGDDQPVGSVLLPKWRQQFGDIQRGVIVSGSEVEEIQCPPGVDGVFAKPADMPAIRACLLS